MATNSDNNYNSQRLFSVNTPTFLTTTFALAFSANMTSAGNSDIPKYDIANSPIWQQHTGSNSVISQKKTCIFTPPKSYKKRYAKISKSKWFHQAYNNMTVGDVIIVEE